MFKVRIKAIYEVSRTRDRWIIVTQLQQESFVFFIFCEVKKKFILFILQCYRALMKAVFKALLGPVLVVAAVASYCILLYLVPVQFSVQL